MPAPRDPLLAQSVSSIPRRDPLANAVSQLPPPTHIHPPDTAHAPASTLPPPSRSSTSSMAPWQLPHMVTLFAPPSLQPRSPACPHRAARVHRVRRASAVPHASTADLPHGAPVTLIPCIPDLAASNTHRHGPAAADSASNTHPHLHRCAHSWIPSPPPQPSPLHAAILQPLPHHPCYPRQHVMIRPAEAETRGKS